MIQYSSALIKKSRGAYCAWRGERIALRKGVDKMANKVTADMTIYDVLCLDPENEKIAQVFFDMGMHCLGCPISRGETVAEAAEAHGNDVNELVNKLNAVIA